jgi:threonine dehydratase
VASAIRQRRPSARIVGVVAERAPAYLLSWQEEQVVETASCDTIADGLAVRRPLAANVRMIRELVDEVIAVSEREMIEAIESLASRERVIAEPAGAAAAAALMKRSAESGTIAALVTGGNITPALRKGLMRDTV